MVVVDILVVGGCGGGDVVNTAVVVMMVAFLKIGLFQGVADNSVFKYY